MKDMKRLYLLVVTSGLIVAACTTPANPGMEVFEFNEDKSWPAKTIYEYARTELI